MKKYFVLNFLVAILLFIVEGCAKEKKPSPSPTPPLVNVPAVFAKGADISWITEMEAAGRRFYNKDGVETDCFALMKSLGMNSIRLRVWVNPVMGWNNATDVVAKALRAKNLGLRIMINFHYSDTWADPANQTKPATWATLNFVDLKNTMATYTNAVLNQLKTAGITPEWVQVGNETSDGMLWPAARATLSMTNYAQFVSAGYDAVKAVFASAKVIVHLPNGQDNSLFRWNIGGLIANGAKFDVIGMSLYPHMITGGWQTANNQCLANMNDMVAQYNKEVMVVEVGMPWDDAASCKAFITDLITKTKSVTANKGLGVMYWEPQSYGNWQGYTLGAFDNNGRPTIALDAFAN